MKSRIRNNPITSIIKDSLNRCEKEMQIAVPFISSFAKTILTPNELSKISKKRLITRLDSSSQNTFELSTLKYLIENGVDIVCNNKIHLKLYTFDDESFVSSSNLTKSGFEDSIELTSIVDKDDIPNCKEVFEKIWNESQEKVLTFELIEELYPEYLLLKKRKSYKQKPKIEFKTKEINYGNIRIEDIIDKLFQADDDYKRIKADLYQSNKDRERIKERIRKKYDPNIFYTDKNHKLRNETLHYKIVYGREGFIAGSGLREQQFKDIFTNSNFKELIAYIYPPSIGEKEWNLNDDDTLREYCNGIFEFQIPQYVETMPIRLASYFYPKYFLPIFKLEHLREMCQILGLEIFKQTKGDQLYTYNKFIQQKMTSIPHENHIKSNIAYQLYFIVKILKGKKEGKTLDQILKENKQNWRKEYINKGNEMLKEIL